MPVISPGPKYGLPTVTGYNKHCNTKIRRPQYSFGYRYQLEDKEKSPGPKYLLEEYDKYGPKNSPKYTLHARLDFKVDGKSPGPAAYGIKPGNLTQYSNPSYTLKDRTLLKVGYQSPSPNTYKFDDKLNRIYDQRPIYSCRKRFKDKDGLVSPGPAAYPCCGRGIDKNYTHLRYPSYSMAKKIEMKVKNETPAANAYKLKYCGCELKPQYSFGIKHHEYAPPFIVECDTN